MTSKDWAKVVFIHLDGQDEAVPAGNLRLLEEGARSLAADFVYGRRYLTRPNAAAIDPRTLPLEEARAVADKRFEATSDIPVFGAIRDAAPDAWGRRVIENELRAEPGTLPESAYLEQAGPHRFGALDFRDTPTSAEKPGMLPGTLELEYLLDTVERVESGLPVPAELRPLLAAGASLGGARPKAAIEVDGRQWIAKFPAQGDRLNVPRVEQATLELARTCGMRVPQTRIVTLPDGRAIMLIERFDRVPKPAGGATRRHAVSGLTFLGLHESDQNVASYTGIVEALRPAAAKGTLSNSSRELFRRMVFNILVSNDDDHLRNHAFVWDGATKGWLLSDLYDVVPKPQAGTDRYLVLGVGKQGRLATLDNALSNHGLFGLLRHDAAEIIDAMARVTREWRVHFENLGVPLADCDKVASAFRNPKDIGLDAVRDARGRTRPGLKNLP